VDGGLFGYYGLSGPIGIRVLFLFFLIWLTRSCHFVLSLVSDYQARDRCTGSDTTGITSDISDGYTFCPCIRSSRTSSFSILLNENFPLSSTSILSRPIIRLNRRPADFGGDYALITAKASCYRLNPFD